MSTRASRVQFISGGDLMKTLVLVALCVVLGLIKPIMAEPRFGVRIGEGYVLLFKDGISPGPVNTRYEITMAVPKGRSVLIFAGGVSVPNDIFRPAPRTSVSVAVKVTKKMSISAGPGYQYNPGYGSKDATHFTGLGVGLAYRIGNIGILFVTGPGRTSGVNVWSWLVQPAVGYTF